MTCVSCGAEQRPGARFCHMCGTPAGTACGSCGAELMPGARFCSECGTPQAGAPAAPLPVAADPVAERKVTSVLFGDLVGFTSLSETRDQEEVRELLSRYFDRSRAVIERYGGTVEKFIGDAVMAVWGVPTAHEDDAERAVRAGLELVRAVEQIGEEVGHPGLALRVGIVTGEVAVTLGAEHQGMVAGDAVNTAARVQSVAEPGQVWVDETTRLLTSAAITFLDVGSHQLKGKADPVPLWRVRAVVAAVGGAQRADGLESPLVGRDRELRLIKDLFHATEETGRPSVVVVNGEAGVGKSRLGWELEKYVDGLTTLTRWHSGRCLSYGEGMAFWAIADAVRGRLGLMDSDPDADPVEALDAGLATYVTDPEESAWLRPRLLVLLGRGAVGTFEREDLFAAWRTFFERVRGDRPMLTLVVDDAHHADEGTVEFVEHLVGQADAPIFVMLMARPGLLERWPTLATNRRSTVLHLSPLDDRDMSDLLDGLVSGLPEQVRDSLVARAEGVPLFAVETVRSLIDRDLVVPRGGVYVLADPTGLDLASIGAPASLQALVAARLDGLQPAQRRLIANASVLGETFGREAIGALCEGIDDIDEVLASLCRLEILGTVANRLSAEYGQYRFVQSVVRQVAYGTLSRRDRKARHLAVAAHLEGFDDPGGDYAPIIAQHYLDAVEASTDSDGDLSSLRRQAVTQLVRSAHRAAALGSPGDALRYLQSALVRADDERLLPLHLDAAWAAMDGGRADSAVEHADAAIALAEAAGDRLAVGDAAAAKAYVLAINLSDNRAALDLTEPLWEELRDVEGAGAVLMKLSRAIGNARTGLGEALGEIDLDRARIAEALGDRDAMMQALMGMGVGMTSNVPTVGRILIAAANDMARADQKPALLARGLANLSALDLPHDTALAIGHCREAMPASQKSGDALSIALAHLNFSLAAFVRGEWAEALEVIDAIRASQVAFGMDVPLLLQAVIGCARGAPPDSVLQPTPLETTTDDAVRLAMLGTHAAFAAAYRGDAEQVRATAPEAGNRLIEVSGLSDDCVVAWPVAVEAMLTTGDVDRVRSMLHPLEVRAHAAVPVGFRGHLHRFLALCGELEGHDPGLLEADLRLAAEEYEEWGSPVYAAHARADLARVLAGAGRLDEAADLRASAVGTFERLGARTWLAEVGEPVPSGPVA